MSSLDARNNSAMMKRAEQLKRWEESDTNRAAPTPRHEHGRRIKFSSGCVFLAACLSGDKDEVVQLLDQGADINTANVDGLTALHQACIDDNLDMVEFLVERGADINRQDNEGWTPLHATASCGFVSIARYLVENGADVAAVNSDGDLALDLAIDVQHMAMIDYMEKMVQELNINVDEARKAEEQAMLNDAKKWLRSDAAEVDRPHPKTGATALHVAAAKGYTKVLGLLLAGRGNVDRQDNDGWTPLHAASHWGQRETAEMLVESLADMDIRNYAGQSCIDVADRKIVKFLEELRANKRNKRRPSSQIRISDAMENHVDKTPTKLVRVEVRTDATKDAENVKPNQQIHAAEHPVEEEAPWRRKLPRTPNDSPTNNQVPDRELSSNSSETANDVILRRTQSFENDQKFYQKYNELRARIKANSCPILPANANASAAAANKSNNNNNLSSNNYHNNNNNNNKSDLLLGYAAGATTTTTTSTSTTTTTSTFNNTHSNTKNTSTSTTQQPQQQPAAASAANQLYSVQRSASLKDNSMYYRKPTITIATPTSTASTAIHSPSTTVQTPPIRSQVTAKIAEKSNNGNSSTASVSDAESSKPPPKQSASNMIKNFFKSFVPPVRDEESETQRKAHAKRVRETRRSTQGVTLDEIKSAEELVKKKNMGMANNNNNNNISTTTTNTISNSGNETSSASSTSAPTPSILGSTEQQDELQPPPPPTTPPPAIIPTTTTATDETEIEEVVSNPPAAQSQNDTTASFTLSAPVRRSLSADREADANSDPEGDQDQAVVSASYTIMPRRERLPESSENVESIRLPQKTDPVAKTASEEKAEEPPHARPTDLPLIPAPAAPSTEAIKSSSAATTPAALESPVRLRDKRGLAGSGSQESETKSDTASPVSSHPDFNARDSLLSLYARRTTDSSAGGGGGGGVGVAGGAASSSSTSAAERRPSWRLKFDAGSKFKLEDITSGGTYPPNNSTIIPSAPAVMAAANLSTTTGVQRRISSGPNALNASNQSLNSVGRPVSAPSEGTNNSAYFSPSARKFETNATPTGATTAAITTSNSTSNSVSPTSANHTAATAPNATSNHDDKDNDKENDNRTQTVIQRRRKPKRRSTGVVHIDMDELDPERQNESSNNDNEEKEKESGSERTSRSRLGSTASTATTSESKSSSSNDKTENGDGIDYKALWEAEKLENDKLRQMLKQKDDEALQTRATLERFANATTKNSLSELEKRERRAMERKLSELEEELKQLDAYKSDNHRLKEENAALIRVISKLSK
ncbi:protein phosphatase 1 regulatory subunit 12B isoform X9 [Drosophila teissieri]|uniref:protein phosphatase 1 regulatory subunit 12B isoform X9 n=1 Tax=Drosophila teissieri TaxID=7243 RepID=UPI001CBA5119|nr:protein phosphatase 1 regulatory subunit 12B isoform X9 [Drosophila teissieri]